MCAGLLAFVSLLDAMGMNRDEVFYSDDAGRVYHVAAIAGHYLLTFAFYFVAISLLIMAVRLGWRWMSFYTKIPTASLFLLPFVDGVLFAAFVALFTRSASVAGAALFFTPLFGSELLLHLAVMIYAAARR